jgi:hypothetical protein
MNQENGVRSFRSWMSVKGAVVPLALGLGLMLSAPAVMPASAEDIVIPPCNPGAVVSPDADGDGLTDDFELFYGTDPNLADTDDDGLTDSDEIACFTSSPWVTDTDDDGLDDYHEFVWGSNPGWSDTDEDGLNDYDEVWVYGTLPTAADSDEDGLSDYEEIINTDTDPLTADTNGDGAPDGTEIAFGSDPLDAQDFPAVQAGPEPGDESGSDSAASDEDVVAEVAAVTSLPSTGAGAHANSADRSGMLALLAGAGSILGSIVLRRRALC